jgi:hypothetical protein
VCLEGSCGSKWVLLIEVDDVHDDVDDDVFGECSSRSTSRELRGVGWDEFLISQRVLWVGQGGMTRGG